MYFSHSCSAPEYHFTYSTNPELLSDVLSYHQISDKASYLMGSVSSDPTSTNVVNAITHFMTVATEAFSVLCPTIYNLYQEKYPLTPSFQNILNESFYLTNEKKTRYYEITLDLIQNFLPSCEEGFLLKKDQNIEPISNAEKQLLLTLGLFKAFIIKNAEKIITYNNDESLAIALNNTRSSLDSSKDKEVGQSNPNIIGFDYFNKIFAMLSVVTNFISESTISSQSICKYRLHQISCMDEAHNMLGIQFGKVTKATHLFGNLPPLFIIDDLDLSKTDKENFHNIIGYMGLSSVFTVMIAYGDKYAGDYKVITDSNLSDKLSSPLIAAKSFIKKSLKELIELRLKIHELDMVDDNLSFTLPKELKSVYSTAMSKIILDGFNFNVGFSFDVSTWPSTFLDALVIVYTKVQINAAIFTKKVDKSGSNLDIEEDITAEVAKLRLINTISEMIVRTGTALLSIYKYYQNYDKSYNIDTIDYNLAIEKAHDKGNIVSNHSLSLNKKASFYKLPHFLHMTDGTIPYYSLNQNFVPLLPIEEPVDNQI